MALLENRYTYMGNPEYLHEDSIDEWCKDNPYITHYYRKTNQDWKYYFKSMFRWHNETVNIWSHFLGFIGIITATIYINLEYDIDKYMTQSVCFNIFTGCMALCYLFSSTMHLLYPKSEKVCIHTQFLDYIGINILIASTFSTFVYFAFYCNSYIQTLYYIVILSLSVIILPISKMKIFMKKEYRWIRPTVFFIYASSFIVPIVHRFLLKEQNDKIYFIELEYFLIAALMYLIGITLYTTRFPERCNKGMFDIIGSSHQLFHIFVLLGGITSLIGVQKAIIGDNEIIC